MRISRHKEILLLISNNGFKDRVAIANKLGLTLSGAKRLVDELLDEKLLKARGQSSPAKGRPSDYFDFDPGFGLIGGLEIGRTFSKSALFDFQGTMLQNREYLTDFSEPPAQFQMRLWSDIMGWAGKQNLRAAAMVAGGIADPNRLMISHLSPAANWQEVAVRNPGGPDMPFALYPYAAAAMSAEMSRGCLRDATETALFFHFGSNVVAALLINGRLFGDGSSPVGHIGHTPLPGNHLTCYCGRTGCAETLASVDGILGQYRRAIEGGGINRAGKITLDNLARSAAAGDELACQVLESGARIAGALLAPSVNLLGIRKIVLGGLFLFLDPKLSARLMAVIETTVREHCFYKNAEMLEIRASALGNDSIITGAAILARNHWIQANY